MILINQNLFIMKKFLFFLSIMCFIFSANAGYVVEDTKEIEDNKLYFENLRYIFEYRGSYTDYLSIAETYLAENNYREAQATLERTYYLFEITEEQSAELKGLQDYIIWRQELSENEQNVYSLSEKEIDYLLRYVEINIGRGTVFAKNILCALYDICLEEEVSDYYVPEKQPEGESVINNASLKVCDKLLSDEISIVPNPTTCELRIIGGELNIEKIEVLDFVGRMVSSHYTVSQNIDISNLNNGIYFIRILTKQGVVVKKVVKQ
jgi:hypothetical protein